MNQPLDPAARSALTRALDGVCSAILPAALAIGVLLCLQWPLRDAVGAGSTQANDLAQWLFAVFVAAAIRHAQVRGAHLVARPDLTPVPGHSPRWRLLGEPLCILPWASFVIGSAVPGTWRSLASWERFPETDNPGYFIIKLALELMALLMALQAASDIVRTVRR